MFTWFNDTARMERLQDIGLLLLRAASGTMMVYAHGWGKLANFGEYAAKFSDPIGIGKTPSLVLAVFAEFFCALLLIPGLYTRLAAIPLIITMLVAGLIVHAADPFGTKERALLFLVIFIGVACAGPGRYSVDYIFRNRR